MYRKLKRNKLWHRKPRFLNRGIEKGWLAPSIQHKINSHVQIVKNIQKILPIYKIILEIANFDIQKINNSDIQGKEYQQGSLYGYENMKSHLIAREHGKCQLCKQKFIKNNPFRIHHIIPRSKGGTDKPSNLALLHKKCHEKLHKKGLNNLLKKNSQYKAETFMNLVKSRLLIKLKELCNNVNITYGNITKIKRYDLELSKEHYNDAFVIVSGNRQIRYKSQYWFQKRRNNRCLQINRKGYKSAIRRQRYDIQPKALIWINNKQYISKGCCHYGEYIVYLNNKIKYISIKKIDKYFNFGGFFIIYSGELYDKYGKRDRYLKQ